MTLVHALHIFAIELAKQGLDGPIEIRIPKADWLRFLGEISDSMSYGRSEGPQNGLKSNEIEFSVCSIPIKLIGI